MRRFYLFLKNLFSRRSATQPMPEAGASHSSKRLPLMAQHAQAAPSAEYESYPNSPAPPPDDFAVSMGSRPQMQQLLTELAFLLLQDIKTWSKQHSLEHIPPAELLRQVAVTVDSIESIRRRREEW